ncbi:MAG TPA: hypothetical protein ENJ09_09020 [Planctomycetes bacterium]|nr:hypothetical protein [Planctomycetota bacterium]
MLLRDSKTRPTAARLLALLFPLVLIGAGILRAGAGGDRGADDAAAEPAPVPARPFGAPGSAEGDEALECLSIELSPRARERLAAARERALATGLIVQRDDDWVDARVGFGGRELDGKLRLKGDWLDHVETDQWSLRIELPEPAVLGMRVFSIQAPQTVGYLWEWVGHRLARELDVLAPRSTFVRVTIDGEDRGVYFLQEHFAKELLESQGRREAAICRFDESTHWDLLLQNDLSLPGPPPIRSGLVVDTAEVRPFGGRKLAASETLVRGLADATEEMRALRALAVEARESAERLRRLEALALVEERDLESSLDIERLARFHALASLLQVEHGLFWHNLRFAFDPVSDRLEPVAFDLMAQMPSEPDPVPLRGHGFVTRFRSSRAYYDGVFRVLGTITERGWLEGRLEELAGEFARFAESMPPGAEEAVSKRLFTERDYLERVAFPAHGANFAATISFEDGGAGTIEVRAWATTRAPIVVEGFRFENATVVPAASVVADAQPEPRREGAGVVLPGDGRSVRFLLGADTRLVGLSSVRDLIASLGDPTDAVGRGLALEALSGPIARLGRSPEARGPVEATALWLRPLEPSWSADGARPDAPTRVEALERHPFLALDPITQEFVAAPGTHAVAGDLVLPEGAGLRIGAGTRLEFEPGALLLATGPLTFEGTSEDPVVLAPRDEGAGWGGVVVLGARGPSRWSGVEVRGTRGIRRGGFAPSGGVTFEDCAVSIADSLFDGSGAGDALNVIRARVHLEGTRFRGAASDSFDGDFVSGDALRCVFEDGGGDGVDLSGSRFEVRDSRFARLADKALSAGEGTWLEVRGGLVTGVGIGVAAKDGSTVRVSSLGLEEIGEFALAAYTKKLAFGPAELRAERLRGPQEVLGALLCERGSSLSVDGIPAPETEIDVRELYRRGILGK